MTETATSGDECTACPAGTYSTAASATSEDTCVQCDAGKYSAGTAQDAADDWLLPPRAALAIYVAPSLSNSRFAPLLSMFPALTLGTGKRECVSRPACHIKWLLTRPRVGVQC